MQEKIKLQYIPLSEIIPYENNPRKNDSAVEVVMKSIKENGFLNPIVLDKNNVIVAGHTRLRAAKKLEMAEVPVIWADDLSGEQIRAYRIMDNKSSEYGIWDEEKLVEEFKEIGDEIINTGFTEDEIEFILDKFDLENEKAKSNETEDFDLNQNKYNIKIGDLIVFDNNHRIVCGDSSKTETFDKLMNKQKIDLVVTSPPYNLDIKYGQYKDNKEMKEYLENMETIFQNIQEHMNKGRFLCLNIGREWGPMNLPAKYDLIMEKLGYSFFRNIYWKKPLGSARGTMTSRNPFPRYYTPKVQTEIIGIYSYDLEKPEIMDLMITFKYSEDSRKKDEKIPKPLYEKYSGNVWEMMTETTLSGKHAAPFPVQLPFNCIKFFSKEGENVLDPFMGSGTTLIATEQTNRRCFGVEMDPNYISFIIERYKQFKEKSKIEVFSNGNKEGRQI